MASPFILAIAGSRSLTLRGPVRAIIRNAIHEHQIAFTAGATRVARGVESIAREYLTDHGYPILDIPAHPRLLSHCGDKTPLVIDSHLASICHYLLTIRLAESQYVVDTMRRFKKAGKPGLDILVSAPEQHTIIRDSRQYIESQIDVIRITSY